MTVVGSWPRRTPSAVEASHGQGRADRCSRPFLGRLREELKCYLWSLPGSKAQGQRPHFRVTPARLFESRIEHALHRRRPRHTTASPKEDARLRSGCKLVGHGERASSCQRPIRRARISMRLGAKPVWQPRAPGRHRPSRCCRWQRMPATMATRTPLACGLRRESGTRRRDIAHPITYHESRMKPRKR